MIEILKSIRLRLGSLTNFQAKNVTCPCCGWEGKEFLERRGIKNSQCPNCGALRRHRWHCLELYKIFTHYPFPKNPRILHVAPEKSITIFLTSRSSTGYISIDSAPGRAWKVANLTHLDEFASDYFNLIFVSHVLEHIKEEPKAIREIYRVLKKKKGLALICVPINPDLEKTKEFSEDEMLLDPNQHLREYGRDFFNHLRNHGFKVKILRSLAYSDALRKCYGIGSARDVAALCEK